MNKVLLAALLLTISHTLPAQNETNWYQFIDTATNRIGYKDGLGNIKIEPVLNYQTQQKVFRNIMPVLEDIPGQEYQYRQYYLLKNGKKVGKDSLYRSDFILDCEQENTIRFKDPKTKKVGFFDQHGNVLIPAIYDEASPFRNGMAIVLQNGKLKCPDGSFFSGSDPCEHSYWDGNFQVINTSNKVVLDSVDLRAIESVDFYSRVINPTTPNPLYNTFAGTDGREYAFKNFQEEFDQWYAEQFLPRRGSASILDLFFPIVTIPKDNQFKSNRKDDPKFEDFAWVIDDKESVWSQNEKYIQSIFQKLDKADYLVSASRGIAPLLLDDQTYPEYFTDCGDFASAKNPYFEILLTSHTGLVIHGMGFLRTIGGYKLIEIY